jgi:hypothetical protein
MNISAKKAAEIVRLQQQALTGEGLAAVYECSPSMISRVAGGNRTGNGTFPFHQVAKMLREICEIRDTGANSAELCQRALDETLAFLCAQDGQVPVRLPEHRGFDSLTSILEYAERSTEVLSQSLKALREAKDPNGPAGSDWTQGELDRFARCCRENAGLHLLALKLVEQEYLNQDGQD